MLVASEEATAGSVIAKHDLICPSKRGESQVSWMGMQVLLDEVWSPKLLSHSLSLLLLFLLTHSLTCSLTFCSSVPYLTSTSILPVSGALQLKI